MAGHSGALSEKMLSVPALKKGYLNPFAAQSQGKAHVPLWVIWCTLSTFSSHEQLSSGNRKRPGPQDQQRLWYAAEKYAIDALYLVQEFASQLPQLGVVLDYDSSSTSPEDARAIQQLRNSGHVVTISSRTRGQHLVSPAGYQPPHLVSVLWEVRRTAKSSAGRCRASCQASASSVLRSRACPGLDALSVKQELDGHDPCNTIGLGHAKDVASMSLSG